MAQVLIQKKTPKEFLGRVYGITMTFCLAFMPIGQIGYGLAFDRFPTYIVLSISAILVVSIASLSNIFLKSSTVEALD